MRIAYTTTFNAQDIHQWSGTPYHMARAFTEAAMQVNYIGSLQRRLPPFFKLKQITNKLLTGQRDSARYNLTAIQHYATQVAGRLATSSVDAVIAPLVSPIAYLDCKQPIVLWTDALYAGLLGFYATPATINAKAIAEGNQVMAACLSRCALAVFSSDWAANTAIELYGADKRKVKVVPYGANLTEAPSAATVQQFIQQRSQDKIRLLFVAKEWERKGGEVAVAVAQALHAAGYPVELIIAGYTPTLPENTPYIHCLGFISKRTPEGNARMQALLAQSHFLILPSRADACPMVFAEANAFGLPCLTTHVGGISTAVKDNVNGMTFAVDAPIKAYCDYIVNQWQDRQRYQALALSSHHEYETRLNWQTAVSSVKKLLLEIK